MEVTSSSELLNLLSTFNATDLSVNELRDHYVVLQRHLALLQEATRVVPASVTELDQLGVAAEATAHRIGAVQVEVAARVEQGVEALMRDEANPYRRSKYRSAVERLSQLLHINPGEVHKRLEVAHAVSAAQGGAVEEGPMHVPVGEAFEAGTISVANASRIVAGVEKLRTPISQVSASEQEADELCERMESELVYTAQTGTPKAVDRLLKTWEHRVNALGVLPTQAVKQDYQGAFYAGRKFGLHEWVLRMDDLQHETFMTAYAPELNPRSTDHVGGDAEVDADVNGEPLPLAADENGKPVEAPKDSRSRGQKKLDGALHAIKVGLTSGNLSLNGGYQAQVVVNIDHKSLEAQLVAKDGLFRSDAVHSGPINPTAIRQLACNAELLPVVLGTGSQVVDSGNRARLFSAEQRKILYARDRGCTFPGCTTGVDRCEAHHVHEYSRGGVTTLENAAMVCLHHHHLVHETGWEIRMRSGVPYWTPPVEEDSRRPLMRNVYFHPEKSTQLPLAV